MKQRSILIVDDDLMTLKYLCYLFSRMGLKIIPADSGEKAIELLATLKIDLVITDLQMGGANGIELLKKAKELDPLRPVIIHTGCRENSFVLEAFQNAASEYLHKPTPVHVLQERVAHLLEKHQRLQEQALSEQL